MSRMCAAAVAGDAEAAAEIDAALPGLHSALFVEPNPIPVKWALARLGRSGPALRLPLVGMSEALKGPLEAAMREAGLL
jgi:4-hydroxy-tetrahydrodipicolinate synthase